jgi:hypothetical protein
VRKEKNHQIRLLQKIRWLARMENAKMGTDGIYRTSDLYIAAWLLSRGLELKDVDCRNRQRCDFVFEDRPDRPELVRQFMCGQLQAMWLTLFIVSRGLNGCCTQSTSKEISPKKVNAPAGGSGLGQKAGEWHSFEHREGVTDEPLVAAGAERWGQQG